tara:strand:- start:5387 stop:6166 length:780 start_codon:yes stop_codon:yes gene_type:complete
MNDHYLNNIDHPLNNSFELRDDWSSSLGLISFDLPDEVRIGLIKCIVKQTYQHVHPMENGYSNKHYYNLFANSTDNEFVDLYKKNIAELIRYYVANAWNVENVADMDIEAKCFGNVQSWGQRTYPHYHHGYDGVAITYLTLGDEISIDVDCMENNNWEDFLIDAPKAVKIVSFAPTAPSTHPKEFEEPGNLILLDPRPAISYPYNRKAWHLKPEVGLTLLHPGYLWHESNPFMGSGIRVAITVNFNISTSKSIDPLIRI